MQVMANLDPKIKELWVNALESGEYKQCRETLYDGAGYCCLGVLARVLEENDLTPTGHAIIMQSDAEFDETGARMRVIAPRGVSSFHMLPASYVDALGLTYFRRKDASGDVDTNGLQFAPQHLANLNDQFRLSFAEIAAFIKETL